MWEVITSLDFWYDPIVYVISGIVGSLLLILHVYTRSRTFYVWEIFLALSLAVFGPVTFAVAALIWVTALVPSCLGDFLNTPIETRKGRD